jgi:hypothetical protein
MRKTSARCAARRKSTARSSPSRSADRRLAMLRE